MRVVDVLGLSFLVLVVLDCATTAYGLAFKPSLTEANPLMRSLPLLVSSLLKIGLSVFAVCLWRAILDHFGVFSWVVTVITLQALTVTVLYLAIVANNIFLILTC